LKNRNFIRQWTHLSISLNASFLTLTFVCC
jgi:hypothetical protein